jgi:long-chain fatty acid transport protein
MTLTKPTIGIGAFAALMLSTTFAGAVGLDRSNQDIGVIFEEGGANGGFAELSFGFVTPSLTGTDVLGNTTGNVGAEFTSLGLAIKMQVNESLSFGLIMDQPYGVDVAYEGSPAATMLGGTAALLESRAITAIARYQINDNFSAHVGLRTQQLNANITFGGLAYGGLNGYNVVMENGNGNGWLAGVAYERPDIALRVALTYNSGIDNEFDTTESVGGTTVAVGTTTVTSPEAWNLDFQTGIAANTLIFGSIRHAMYSQTLVSPAFFAGATGGGSITDIDDGTSYNIGVGRRFSDAFSASVSIGFEAESDDNLVSPLSPTNGTMSIGLGGQYTMGDIVLSGGIRYSMLGDAFAETGTPDAARASFDDSSALAIGFSVGYNF